MHVSVYHVSAYHVSAYHVSVYHVSAYHVSVYHVSVYHVSAYHMSVCPWHDGRANFNHMHTSMTVTWKPARASARATVYLKIKSWPSRVK
jgi:hypothetical protein